MLLISCPFCGERPEDEFGFGGDASVRHQGGGDGTEPASVEQYADYLYLRDNPKGRHAEYWVHRYGCRRWLVAERDTVTHEIFSVKSASEGGTG
ncbi:MAG: sarcosine oxidase subunit delta [Alphaproteobacteria bacterium]|nr:sarcosine oxidase subunit delta [Alphaproteobacteria bacterium]